MVELSGAKVLLVEDEGLVALMLEDMLEELGLKVVASAAHVQKACELATTASFDLALLDVNLAGELVFPVARILRERRIPFLFSTGYGGPPLEEEFNSADSDEAGHAFQFEAGRVFRSEAGHPWRRSHGS
ncbi:response regulator, partial [Bradyrhizobium sp. 35]|uniref:response regulator n=1 Tax=Bradyrhizobium sp. 35 TaxID=2782670 RepID=UPI001FF77F7F